MSPTSAKADILRDKILEELSAELAASSDPGALMSEFQDRAQDYATLALMGEVPRHANAALTAWQSMDHGASATELLRLLSDVYRDATTGSTTARNQAGQ